MNYKELEKFLSKRLNHAEVFIIGTSVLGRFIYGIKFNFNNKDSVIIQGAIHAREHITTDLICELIKDTSKNYNKLLSNQVPNIIFLPMLNPDGVELCYKGIRSVKNKEQKRFLLEINGGKDFKLYKANANGVDLNTNFDAKWGSGIENKQKPSPSGYIGKSPMSEPEVQYLACLTNKVKPFFTISYHAKGQELYYQFHQEKNFLSRDRRIAKILARSLKYEIVNTENVSGGGYKDWCIARHKIPAVTIEVGKDSLVHPIKRDCLPQIYKRNKNIITLLSKVLKEYKNDTTRKIYENGNKGSQEGAGL